MTEQRDSGTSSEDNRVTVLFFCNSLPYFLAHRINLALPLLRSGHKVVLVAGEVTPSARLELPVDIHLEEVDLHRHRLSPVSDYRVMRHFLDAVRRHRPQVVHAITIKPALLAAMGLPRLGRRWWPLPRLVLTFPGLGRVFEGEGAWSALRRRIVSAAFAIGLRRLDHVATFENPADRDALVRRGLFSPDRAVALMGAGIALDLFHAAPEGKSGSLTFLLASRLLHAKGIALYVDACNRLAMAGVKARFLLAGPNDPGYPDNYDPENERAAGRLGVVEYLGAVPPSAMPELLRASDVVCLPSCLREGFPRSLIEAAACGTALIGSDQPSIRQIVLEGETGWLVKMGDVESLAAAMRDAAADPTRTRSMGRAAAALAGRLPVGDEAVFAQFWKLYRL